MIESNYNSHFKDKIIRCVDCGNDFVFTAGEQAFFNGKRPPLSEPKRCKACRDFRRRTINPGVPWSDAVARANTAYDTTHDHGDHPEGVPNG